jgi:ribosomal protein L16 Arg81 hydroxylase
MCSHVCAYAKFNWLSHVHTFSSSAANPKSGPCGTTPASKTVRLENLLFDGDDDVPGHVTTVRRGVRAVFGMEVTPHLYISGPGERTLSPHTDPYDTVILQTVGHKEWTTCVPQLRPKQQQQQVFPPGQEHVADTNNTGTRTDEHFSDAELCQLHEAKTKNVNGCTAYSERDLAKMACQTFELHEGDLLYMPKGVVHFAQTAS